MLPIQFFAQLAHFALNLIAGLVFFASVWLYFDAWLAKKQSKELFKWGGFLVLSVGFIAHSVLIEQTSLATPLLGGITEQISLLLRLIGYALIAWGMMIDPLPVIPKSLGLTPPHTKSEPSKAKGLIPVLPLSVTLQWFIFPLALLTSWLYWRRATTGLERHLKPIAKGFLVIALAELFSLGFVFRESGNLSLAQLSAPFGPLWLIEHLLLATGVFILGKWLWNYLLTRIQTQLLMIFSTAVVIIFLLITSSFTFLLMRNLESDALNNLNTAANVLHFAFESKRAETITAAESIAQNQLVVGALQNKDFQQLEEQAVKLLQNKKISHLTITNEEGQVVMRADDPSRWGDSISSNPLIQRALLGRTSASILAKEEVLSPSLSLSAASPIRDLNQLVTGAVVVEVVVDNNFVDGVKDKTGLDSAVYAGNVRSATTFVAPDGVSRWVGIKEENKLIKDQVLGEGQSFLGSTLILNQNFLAVFSPIKDIDNAVVGMLFIGQPSISLLQTASQSIELTFVVAALLLILFIYPSFRIARYIAAQVS